MSAVQVIYFDPGQNIPEIADDRRWLIVEASGDGRFFGSGGSWKPDGKWVGYGSIAEDDVSLKTALAAAHDWAIKYHVPLIWVQVHPGA